MENTNTDLLKAIPALTEQMKAVLIAHEIAKDPDLLKSLSRFTEISDTQAQADLIAEIQQSSDPLITGLHQRLEHTLASVEVARDLYQVGFDRDCAAMAWFREFADHARVLKLYSETFEHEDHAFQGHVANDRAAMRVDYRQGIQNLHRALNEGLPAGNRRLNRMNATDVLNNTKGFVGELWRNLKDLATDNEAILATSIATLSLYSFDFTPYMSMTNVAHGMVLGAATQGAVTSGVKFAPKLLDFCDELSGRRFTNTLQKAGNAITSVYDSVTDVLKTKLDTVMKKVFHNDTLRMYASLLVSAHLIGATIGGTAANISQATDALQAFNVGTTNIPVAKLPSNGAGIVILSTYLLIAATSNTKFATSVQDFGRRFTDLFGPKADGAWDQHLVADRGPKPTDGQSEKPHEQAERLSNQGFYDDMQGRMQTVKLNANAAMMQGLKSAKAQDRDAEQDMAVRTP